MSSARPSISIPRRTVLVTLTSLTAAALLLTRLWAGPERLLDLPFRRYGSVLTVLDGELYYREQRPNTVGLVVRAVPVRGGRPRLVLRDSTVPPSVDEVQITRQGIYYRYREQVTAPFAPPVGLPGAPPAPPAPVTLPPDPIQPRPLPQPLNQAASRERIWVRLPRMRLRYAPLSGGAPRELLPEIRAVDLRVSGGYCYWLRSKLIGPGEPLRSPDGSRPITELMVSPLAGGETRRIALGVNTLWVGTDGAFWPVAEAQQRFLIHTFPPDFSLHVLNGYTGLEAPVQHGGRLYWLAAAPNPEDHFMRPAHQVVTSEPDGTDFRVLLDVDPQRRGLETVHYLRSHDSDLLFFRGTRRENGQSSSMLLCRLRPGAATRKLSDGITNVTSPFWLDRGNAYFLRAEIRENWFDWSTDGLAPRRVVTLHRLPVTD